MQPFKIRIDWTCHESYGDPVEVELHVLGEDWTTKEPVVIRKFPTIEEAIHFSKKFFNDRGLNFSCNVDLHQRMNHKHITMHPVPIQKEFPFHF